MNTRGFGVPSRQSPGRASATSTSGATRPSGIATQGYRSQPAPLPAIAIRRTWEEIVFGEARNELELILPTYLQGQRWFGGKARKILSARLVDAVGVPYRAAKGYLALVRVDYMDADSELYSLPLTSAPAARAGDYPAPARVARLPGRDRIAKEMTSCSMLSSTPSSPRRSRR